MARMLIDVVDNGHIKSVIHIGYQFNVGNVDPHPLAMVLVASVVSGQCRTLQNFLILLFLFHTVTKNFFFK